MDSFARHSEQQTLNYFILHESPEACATQSSTKQVYVPSVFKVKSQFANLLRTFGDHTCCDALWKKMNCQIKNILFINH